MKEATPEKPTLDPKDLAFWRAEIKASRQKRTDVAEAFGWKQNLERYIPRPLKAGTVDTHVNTGSDFRDVERKKAALFYDTPNVCLTVKQDRPVEPKTPAEMQAAAGLKQPLMLSTLTMWEQEMLNALLGPQHANVKPTVLNAIFECLCPSGIGPVSIGYQVTMRKIPQTTPVMDEMGNPVMEPPPITDAIKSALGMPVAPPKPLMETIEVDVPIHERWFVSNYSSMAQLTPASFKSTDYQRAPWLGKDWRKPTSQVKREYHLGADWTGGTADDTVKTTFDEPNDVQVDEDAAGDPYLTGSEIYYRKQLRSEEEEHPEALMHLVLLDGADTPLVHRECPYQDFDPTTGEMTPDSLKGFVDRPLVLRQLSDSAWIPSDCSVTRQLTTEVEKFREQSIIQRKNSRSVILVDASKIDPTVKDKVLAGEVGTFVPVIEGALMGGIDSIMKQVAQPTLGRENFMAQDIIERDREQILGIGANQTGTQTKGAKKTATEQTIVQRNSEARFEQERQKVLSWFLNDIAQPFDMLILRYADERIAVQILGEVRGKLWAAFKGHLAGGYAYGLMVDSGKYIDVEADRRQILQEYGQLRKDPLINPKVLIDALAEKYGHDPSEFYVAPQPPQKELKAAITIKGEDLNPQNPAFAIMVELARQGGWNISPGAVQLAQEQSMKNQTMQPGASGVSADPNAPPDTQHPGSADMAPMINKHHAEESGDRSGPKVSVN